MSIRPIVEGVYQISQAWGNSYLLVEGDRAALVDTGLRQDRANLIAALAKVGVAETQVESLFLTHGHCDHAGSAAYFARRSGQGNGATLYAGRAEAPFLSLPRRTYAPTGAQALLRPLSVLSFLVGEKLYPVERCGVDCLLDDGDVVNAPGGPLRVVACPGHTKGQIAFFRERDGVLFSGDGVLNIIPLLRVVHLSLAIRIFSDNWAQTKRSAKRLAELRPNALLPGHGPPIPQDAADRLTAWAATLA